MKARVSKYGNKKTVVDGITFDSKREAARYQELRLLEKAGEISGLDRQWAFECRVNDKLVCKYRADFTYMDKGGKFHVIDVKGYRTDVYRLKKKLVEAIHGITIEEV